MSNAEEPSDAEFDDPIDDPALFQQLEIYGADPSLTAYFEPLSTDDELSVWPAEPTPGEVTLMRQYGFDDVAEAIQSCDIRIWLVSSYEVVSKVDYRWVNESRFRKCEFVQERRTDVDTNYNLANIEVRIPMHCALPLRSPSRQQQLVFRIKFASQESSIQVAQELLHVREVNLSPSPSWSIAADLLDDNGFSETAVLIRQCVERL